MTPEEAAHVAAECYAGHPAAPALILAAVAPEASEARTRAAAALRLLDPLDRARIVEAPRPECPRCGRDSCAGDCRPRARVEFRGAAAWMADPRPAPIVEGVAWAGCTTVLVAESGTGKTFLLLDLASALVAGRPWHGRETQRGTVAYVTWEGDSLGVRLRALDEAGRGVEGVELLRLSQPLSARPGRDGAEGYAQGEAILAAALAELAQRLEAAARPPILLLVLDTLRASMSGSEDSSEDTAAYLRAVRRILAPYPGAGAIVAHHAGWQDSTETRKRRERGSSAIRGNVDATLYLEAGDYDELQHVARLELRALKVRDEERPAPLRLIRRRVELLERDTRGRIATSCLIDTDPTTPADREADERAEAAQAEAELEGAILHVIRTRPITGLRGLALHVRATCGPRRDEAIRATLDRLIAGGRIVVPTRQRQPYSVSVAQ
ncbi:MAG: AAA family ATPase [Vicinamibacteria bacterium]|nr:AAA family ATPase [Vicinamibacteria bacterium]